MTKVSTSIPKILGKLYGFPKKFEKSRASWEKISKFLGDLPSEQIFYRNIPLGALEMKVFVEVCGILEVV